jgi:hypothetical protein
MKRNNLCITKSLNVPFAFIFPSCSLILINNDGDYCNGLLECPIIVSSFIIMQQAHFCCKQIFDSSCLQIVHIHACLITLPLLSFCFFVLALRYSHNTIIDTPIIMKTRNILIPARSISNNIPNTIMTMP